MKKKELTVINGKTFTVDGTTDRLPAGFGVDESEIYREYGRPSETKVNIWRSWCKWARECGADIRIASSNCMMFTICGKIVINGEAYRIYITKSYNRLYKLV